MNSTFPISSPNQSYRQFSNNFKSNHLNSSLAKSNHISSSHVNSQLDDSGLGHSPNHSTNKYNLPGSYHLSNYNNFIDDNLKTSIFDVQSRFERQNSQLEDDNVINHKKSIFNFDRLSSIINENSKFGQNGQNKSSNQSKCLTSPRTANICDCSRGTSCNNCQKYRPSKSVDQFFNQYKTNFNEGSFYKSPKNQQNKFVTEIFSDLDIEKERNEKFNALFDNLDFQKRRNGKIDDKYERSTRVEEYVNKHKAIISQGQESQKGFGVNLEQMTRHNNQDEYIFRGKQQTSKFDTPQITKQSYNTFDIQDVEPVIFENNKLRKISTQNMTLTKWVDPSVNYLFTKINNQLNDCQKEVQMHKDILNMSIDNLIKDDHSSKAWSEINFTPTHVIDRIHTLVKENYTLAELSRIKLLEKVKFDQKELLYKSENQKLKMQLDAKIGSLNSDSIEDKHTENDYEQQIKNLNKKISILTDQLSKYKIHHFNLKSPTHKENIRLNFDQKTHHLSRQLEYEKDLLKEKDLIMKQFLTNLCEKYPNVEPYVNDYFNTDDCKSDD